MVALSKNVTSKRRKLLFDIHVLASIISLFYVYMSMYHSKLIQHTPVFRSGEKQRHGAGILKIMTRLFLIGAVVLLRSVFRQVP